MAKDNVSQHNRACSREAGKERLVKQTTTRKLEAERGSKRQNRDNARIGNLRHRVDSRKPNLHLDATCSKTWIEGCPLTDGTHTMRGRNP